MKTKRKDQRASDRARLHLKTLIETDTSTAEHAQNLLGTIHEFLNDEAQEADNAISLRLAKREGEETPCALVMRIGPKREGGLVLSGHVDVVPPNPTEPWIADPFKLTARGGSYYGRGTCDMKGFISAVLAKVPTWATADLARPLFLCLTTDEETGSTSLPYALDLLRQEPRPTSVIVGEPTNMDVVVASKGTNPVFVDIYGKAAHSSNPARGIDAEEIAAELKTFLYALGKKLKTEKRNEAFDPPYPVINIGKGGFGDAMNIVPGHAFFNWHLRQIEESHADEVTDLFHKEVAKLLGKKAFKGAKVEIRTNRFPSLEERAMNTARDIALKANPDAKIVRASFASEAGFFQKEGYDVAICGPGDIAFAHATNERLPARQLQACVAFLSRLAW